MEAKKNDNFGVLLKLSIFIFMSALNLGGAAAASP